MIYVCLETAKFTFLTTYQQVIKFEHDKKKKRRRKKSQTANSMKNKQLKFITGMQEHSKMEVSI